MGMAAHTSSPIGDGCTILMLERRK
jgi:hypothetical protein